MRGLFRDLAAAGLRVHAGDEDWPVFDGLTSDAGGVRLAVPDPEPLLRSRPAPLPRGYGVIPLRGAVPGMEVRATGAMQFYPHSPRQPELDGVHLRFDDATLRAGPRSELEPVGPGWQALLRWYGVLCEHLRVAYGYGDWEDLFLQFVVPPSRADVLRGELRSLFRLNGFGPALVRALGDDRLLSLAADAVLKLRYGGVLVGLGLSYAGGDGGRDAAARYLGMRSA
ncbi:MAG TPA: hypothetical protein VKV26_11805 [Dehalococcoidia bacterium]|nr:hypothetical protein [Dehalococcoidia bacterium]